MAPIHDQIELRPATIDDASFMYELRHEPGYLTMAINRETIPPQAHLTWFKAVLADASRQLWIVEHDGIRAGMVRLDQLDASNESQQPGCVVEVSIAMMPECRGRGLGKQALNQAIARWVQDCEIAADSDRSDVTDQASQPSGHAVLQAHVRSENVASLRLFESCRFTRVGTTTKQGSTLIVLQRELDSTSSAGDEA